MNIIKRYLSLLFLLGVSQLCGFAQIKVVDDDYKPNLGGLEEIKLEDIDSKWNFDFAVGDSIYVLESESASKLDFLCFSKNTNKMSIKHIQPNHYYVVDKIYFGDSINQLKMLIDNQFPPNAVLYDEWNNNDFYYISGDPVFSTTIPDYDNKIKVNTKAKDAILYSFEDENGDLYFIDKRRIEIKTVESRNWDENFYNPHYYSIHYNRIKVLRLSDYQETAKDIVGKKFHLFTDTSSESERIHDYITQKEINVNLTGGSLINYAMDIDGEYCSDCSIFGIENYYQCKDLIIYNGKFVVILGNELGEFSALLNMDDGNLPSFVRPWQFSIVKYWIYYYNSMGYNPIYLVPKDKIDSKFQEWRMSEKEKKVKRQKAEQERIAKQKKHNADIIAKYGEKYGKMILQHKVAIGMSKEMCREAGWYPRDTYRTTTNRGVSEIWVINYKTALYFSDGILYMIEN